MITERRAARERALSLLYEAEQRSCAVQDLLDELPVEPEPYACELALAADADRSGIDALLEDASVRWHVERMPAIDRNVLRLAVAELQTQPGVPTAVVLDEAIELAKEYSTADSGRFVNGVLAKLVPTLRPGS